MTKETKLKQRARTVKMVQTVSGGEDGTNGKDGVTPKLEIRESYWWISYDNGTNWTQLGKATGEDGINGNSIFKSVTQDDNNVYFTLENDSVITIPKSDNSKFAIAFDTTDIAILNGGREQNNFLHD